VCVFVCLYVSIFPDDYDISAKSKIWAEVVQYFTESESCVRFEVQEIDGEDFEVWRWVQPMSRNE